jgi:hypothetical protein
MVFVDETLEFKVALPNKMGLVNNSEYEAPAPILKVTAPFTPFKLSAFTASRMVV